MDDALRVVVEMNETIWGRLKTALEDLSEEEIHWRPLPQANSINVIIRHLRIEAQWHLDSLENGEPMPTIAAPAPQEAIDAVPADFEENLKMLEDLHTRFVEILRTATLVTLRQRTAAAYGDPTGLPYRLSYHQAIHLAMHCGQISSIRNLYRKTRGEPARFFPENPTYQKRS
ncbi:MAG TPA: DinB family protein [Blastocatellia bacterium]|nr:DinB family protein [Blastocatellia bacterium]